MLGILMSTVENSRPATRTNQHGLCLVLIKLVMIKTLMLYLPVALGFWLFICLIAVVSYSIEFGLTFLDEVFFTFYVGLPFLVLPFFFEFCLCYLLWEFMSGSSVWHVADIGYFWLDPDEKKSFTGLHQLLASYDGTEDDFKEKKRLFDAMSLKPRSIRKRYIEYHALLWSFATIIPVWILAVAVNIFCSYDANDFYPKLVDFFAYPLAVFQEGFLCEQHNRLLVITIANIASLVVAIGVFRWKRRRGYLRIPEPPKVTIYNLDDYTYHK